MFLDQKHFGLILSEDERNNMILDGIQSEDLCKIRSGAGDRKTSGVDAEKKTERRLQKEVPRGFVCERHRCKA